ncbi:MAG: hypothetical protein AB1512_02995 [Thermodesulfobacteriota bacterium]
MSYPLVIPPDYLRCLVAIRAATGVSIRKQLLIATGFWIMKSEEVKA